MTRVRVMTCTLVDYTKDATLPASTTCATASSTSTIRGARELHLNAPVVGRIVYEFYSLLVSLLKLT